MTDPLAPSISIEELRAFAREFGEQTEDGEPIDYYSPKWVAALDDSERLPFHWAACIFGWNWCLWRKQYRTAFLVLSAELVLGVAFAIAYIVSNDAVTEADPFLNFGVYLVLPFVRVPLGFMANRLYLSEAIATIESARAFPTSSETFREIEAQGGTSGIALAIGILLNLVINIWGNMPAA